MQLVDDDVPALAGEIQPHDDDVLAVGRVGGERNLACRRVDELAVALLQVLLLRAAEVLAPLTRPVQAIGDAAFDGSRGEASERMHGGRVEIGLVGDDRKIGAHRSGEDRAGAHCLLGEDRSRRPSECGERAGAGDELPATKTHGKAS